MELFLSHKSGIESFLHSLSECNHKTFLKIFSYQRALNISIVLRGNINLPENSSSLPLYLSLKVLASEVSVNILRTRGRPSLNLDFLRVQLALVGCTFYILYYGCDLSYFTII